MNVLRFFSSLLIVGLCASPSLALPGQKTETVAAWMAGHPLLQPVASDGLTVKRTSTAAQRFEFRASVLAPGKVSYLGSRGVIRNEFFSVVDRINGISWDLVEQSLRDIYGFNIYQDYRNANIVYSYPSAETLEMSRRMNLPSIAAQKGEIRIGEQFAYWIELTRNNGDFYAGQMTVFLHEDVDKLIRDLSD